MDTRIIPKWLKRIGRCWVCRGHGNCRLRKFEKIIEIFKNQNIRPILGSAMAQHTNDNRNLMQITGNHSHVDSHIDDRCETWVVRIGSQSIRFLYTIQMFVKLDNLQRSICR